MLDMQKSRFCSEQSYLPLTLDVFLCLHYCMPSYICKFTLFLSIPEEILDLPEYISIWGVTYRAQY